LVGGHVFAVGVEVVGEAGAAACFFFNLFIALESADTVSSHAGLSQSSWFFKKISRGDGFSCGGIFL